MPGVMRGMFGFMRTSDEPWWYGPIRLRSGKTPSNGLGRAAKTNSLGLPYEMTESRLCLRVEAHSARTVAVVYLVQLLGAHGNARSADAWAQSDESPLPSWEDGTHEMPKSVRQKSVNHKRATRSNKAQQRASQVRIEQMAATPAGQIDDQDEEAAELPVAEAHRSVTVVPASTAVPAATAVSPAPTAKGSRAALRRTARQPVAKAKSKTLTREQEYGFIRADLRRLLYTAGGVMVFMIALLLVIEQ